jgi:hypothetical protein
MLTIEAFFASCAGEWTTERIYHYPQQGEVERSYTEFSVESLTLPEKHYISSCFFPPECAVSPQSVEMSPGFAIAFDTRSESGEEVSMRVKALFVTEQLIGPLIASLPVDPQAPGIPGAASVPNTAELVRGYYLRDEGYSESGAITGKFTYLPSRSTLEMTTYYSRSVAVDQMRFLSHDLRMRTIVTYQRPPAGESPQIVTLVGFGLEKRR